LPEVAETPAGAKGTVIFPPPLEALDAQPASAKAVRSRREEKKKNPRAGVGIVREKVLSFRSLSRERGRIAVKERISVRDDRHKWPDGQYSGVGRRCGVDWW
jgi:hypothetical protein